jgi:hypothetical protein
MADDIDLACFTAQPAQYAKKYPRIDAYDDHTREAVQELKVMAASYGIKEARETPILYVRVPTCNEATVRSMRKMCEQARA